MTKHTWLRKLGGLFMAVSLLCSVAAAAPAEETDLLQAGSYAADWTFTPSVEGGASLAEEDGAAVITVTEGSAVLSKQTKLSLARSVNAVTFTAKAEGLAEGSSAVVRLLRAENTTVNECQSAPITVTEWTTVTMYFTPGTGQKKLVEIAVTGAGKLYIKDMTVTQYEGNSLCAYGNAEAFTQTNSKMFTGGDAAITTEQSYDGLASYKGTKMRTDAYTAEAGATYRLSFAFYSASATSPRVQIGWNTTANGTSEQVDLEKCTAGEWKTYSYYIMVPYTFGDAETAVTGMYLFLRSSGGGTVYYDTISIEKKDAGLKNAAGGDASLVSGETVTAFTTVEAGKSGTALVALYKKDGETRTLIGIETAPIVAAEAVQAATVNYTLPGAMEAGEYVMTVFAWDMANGLSSLKDAYAHAWTVQQ